MTPPRPDPTAHAFAAEGALVARNGESVVVVPLNELNCARLLGELAAELLLMTRKRLD